VLALEKYIGIHEGVPYWFIIESTSVSFVIKAKPVTQPTQTPLAEVTLESIVNNYQVEYDRGWVKRRPRDDQVCWLLY